jgi:predicted TIM-barrel fold metal-dependent hydrolase
MDLKLYEKLLTEFEAVHIIDSHDHTMAQELAMKLSQNPSYLYDILLMQNNRSILTYMPDESWRMAQFDFGEAYGIKGQKATADDLRAMWRKLQPVLEYIRNDNQQRTFMRACKKLFDLNFDKMETESQWIELSEKFSRANQDKGWYRRAIKEVGHIDLILDVSFATPQVDRTFFRSVMNMTDFLRGFDESYLHKIEQKYGVTVKSFDDYLGVLDVVFKQMTSQGTVALKDNSGYFRDLTYRDVTKKAASKAFEPVSHLGWANKSVAGEDVENFTNFMMNELARKCAVYGIPFQIHTGPPGNPANCNPAKLQELFETNPETTFVVLHGAGVNVAEIASFLKFYKNIYTDLAWHVNGFPGPSGLKRVMYELLEYVPYHKFCWGADCGAAEESVGIYIQAREILAEVLARKVEEKWEDFETAVRIGKAILRDNAIKLYKLDR